MSMSRKKCCVPGGMESESSHKTLHLFPNPAKDIERFNKWVYSIRGDIIGLDNEDIYKNRSVCHAHFEEKFCCRYNRLSNIAVPTLNLPGSLSLPRFTFGERRPIRQIQNCSIDTPSPTPSPTPSTLASLATPSTSVFTTGLQQEPLTITLAGKSQNDGNLKENIEYHSIPRATCIAKNVRKQVRVTPEEQTLRKKLIQARIKISKCRKMVAKQSASLKAAKNIATNPALLATIEKFPSTTKILIMI